MKTFPEPWWRRLKQWIRWRLGHKSEEGFWDRYLRTRGLRWQEEFAGRMNPELELDAELAALLPPSSHAAPKILDVGAGPLSVVGKRRGGLPLDLTAVDPLAADYDRLLAKHGLNPPVRTQRGCGEDVATMFPANSFDLAHARNCLDHGVDPLQAVTAMLNVVRPGGWVYLKHHPNEGLNEQWHGLHQWNFSMSATGDFIISSRNHEANVTQEFAGRADVRCELRTEAGEEWLIVQIHKR